MTAPGQSRIIITVGVVVSAAFALIFFAVMPQMAQIRNAVSGIAGNREQIDKIQRELSGYQMSHSELEKIKNEKVVQEMFPQRESMAPLVAALENAVKSSGGAHALTIVDKKEEAAAGGGGEQKPAPPVVPGLAHVEEIPYSLEFTGNYRQIVNFLLYLENLPFVSRVTNLSLAAESKQVDEVVHNTGLATAKIEALFFIKNQ